MKDIGFELQGRVYNALSELRNVFNILGIESYLVMFKKDLIKLIDSGPLFIAPKKANSFVLINRFPIKIKKGGKN